MKHLFFLLLKAWVSIIIFFILFIITYKIAEFFRMLIFLKINFLSFRKLNKRDKRELLYMKLNFAQGHNEMKCRFIVANFQRIAKERIISPYDLLDDLIFLKWKIQNVVYDDLKIERWKKMFLT